MDGEELPALLRQARDGECHVRDLVHRLRAAWLVVEVETASTGHEVLSFLAEGLRWLPVFTSLEQWAQFLVAAGRGEERAGYGWVSGAELFDEVVPQLAVGTGVLVDPMAEHVLALPPTTKSEENDG